jgi:hypothetical protein
MNTLDDAWRWYSVTRDNLQRMNSLARRYWQQLPWEGELGRNDEFRLLESADVLSETRFSLDFLDDLAVVVLFSVFEAVIRSDAKLQVESEAAQLTHPILRQAADDALWVVNEGSFARVLEPYKALGHADLIEEVNQVRKYRNFVAHGRRGEQPAAVSPNAAYDRLTRLLAVVLPNGEGSSEQGE